MTGHVRCAPWVSWAPGGDALVLFNGQDGSYHALNGSAARIWRAISDGQQPGEAAAAIAAEHGVSADQVAPDIDAFVEQARGKNLLVDD